ncbi:helix-turn-helix transcriptional regulator [Salmonella enterica]|nr:helix-turn-helix transcriptional regulator [Salmonella enterica]ECW0264955.1 helix-turn-helix transcriptional regulator [Salmonella enterica subsp. diarizonae]EBD5983678.1 helix-turn-helix transcriptional regulator [Salmonella enterica]EBI4324802.1 helix-turn-helix transcriptional regulator [Salmonella enterica]ECO4385968.1 helix-turn-helix transcriptional regulator [Salmonella enterica]
MSSLAERLKLAMSQTGITQAELAKQSNLSQGAINKLVSGKAKSSKGLLAIALALDVDPRWLQWGVGDLTPPPDSRKERKKLAFEHEVKTEIQRNRRYYDVEVPFVDGLEFIGGDGSYSEVNEDEPFKIVPASVFERCKVYSKSVNLICFLFHGDSMSPAIIDSALVFVDTKDKKIRDGLPYAINQDGWKRVRFLDQTSPSKLKIRSCQPEKYPDEEAAIDSVEILGRVFMVTSIY